MKREKELRDQHLHLRMSDEDKRELEIFSYLDDTTQSEYIRRAICFYHNLSKHAPDVLKQLEKEYRIYE